MADKYPTASLPRSDHARRWKEKVAALWIWTKRAAKHG